MWKPSQVQASHRRRAVMVWIVSVVGIIAYSGWLFYKAAEKAKAPDTSFALTNVVYKYPDLWICPYVNYGCDEWELEEECVDSAWMTEGGKPDAVFYPRVKLDQLHQVTTEERQINAIPDLTNFDSEGNEQENMYWYPGGKFGNSTTCVAEGVEWADHREWVYGFLSDPEDPTAISTGFPLSYSCITNTSNTHIFNTLGIGLTNQNKFMSDDISSYKALFTNFGVHKNTVNPNITMPYAHVSLEMKQQADSWEIITESNPYEFAEMFGNIGGFWGECDKTNRYM
ncbi:hypothetical protein Esi_0005_0114 [Ectocarpus siliculosus]|uniref:Uncharacterized protein n=1 Tax=Ectocarpus siliculosus TaxID=2880 RepID=D8LNQ0_ECTSI|nr:hypothetical protein Esi_0005_0114 [Ectocarpus siliculosus]|eukprot:CBN78260.1 hypothetical protein Esi_0005_0114 [Ectocarpus siliculosus]